MKSVININRFFLAGLLLPMLLLQSCLKDKNQLTDFSGESTQPIVEIPEGGMGNFGNDALLLKAGGPDTVYFHLNLASTDFLNKDLTVTVGYDAAALAAYNATSTTQYAKFPDSIFSFPQTKFVIKAGTRAVAIPIIFYPNKIDASQNYMFPVTITDASGTTISGNFGTIYLHLIGNKMAGVYDVTGTRYNYSGQVSWSGPPAAVPSNYVATTNMANYSPRTAVADNGTTIEIPFGNVGTGYNYIITQTSPTTISVDYTFTSVYSNITPYVISFTPPGPGQKASFHIITHYNNALGGAGNDRIFDETFVQQ